jgi:hypothetical protein
MGWSIGFDERWERDIGCGVPAQCDFPNCKKQIDRGLAYVCCEREPYGGDRGCGLYLCDKHHNYCRGEIYGLCSRCFNYRKPFTPKPDVSIWTNHKMTHASWAEWRKTQATSLFSLPSREAVSESQNLGVHCLAP